MVLYIWWYVWLHTYQIYINKGPSAGGHGNSLDDLKKNIIMFHILLAGGRNVAWSLQKIRPFFGWPQIARRTKMFCKILTYLAGHMFFRDISAPFCSPACCLRSLSFQGDVLYIIMMKFEWVSFATHWTGVCWWRYEQTLLCRHQWSYGSWLSRHLWSSMLSNGVPNALTIRHTYSGTCWRISRRIGLASFRAKTRSPGTISQ